MDSSLRGRWPILALVLVAALAPGACSDSATPSTPDPEPDPPHDPNQVTEVVGSQGGTVLLDDGSGVIIPAGALAGNTPIGVSRVDPASRFQIEAGMERHLLTLNAPIERFQIPVRVRVPVPASVAEDDILAGVLHAETGGLMAREARIRSDDGGTFVEVETDHFSQWLFGWFRNAPPDSSGLLPVPYYSQGSSDFCWATGLHMLIQSLDLRQFRGVDDIIGRVGVDEGGISGWEFRFGAGVTDVVQRAAAVRAERTMWTTVEPRRARNYLKQQLGIHNRPVLFFHGGWNHAVVFVGYEGDDFFIHDPAATDDRAIGYQRRAWSDIAGDVGWLHNVLTLVVPKAPGVADPPVTLNLLPQSVNLVEPGRGDVPTRAWVHGWDHNRSSGYSFRETAGQTVGDPMPGEVTLLRVTTALSLANASPTDSRTVVAHLRVAPVDVPSDATAPFVAYDTTLTLPPNSLVGLRVPPIPVDSFRFNQAEPTEYVLAVTLRSGGATADAQQLTFHLAGLTPSIARVGPATGLSRGGDPSSAGTAEDGTPVRIRPGERVLVEGSDFGPFPLGNRIRLGGVEVGAEAIELWADGRVIFRVPESIPQEGSLIVERGTVPSNAVAYDVPDEQILEGSRSHTQTVGPMTVTLQTDWTLVASGVAETTPGDAAIAVALWAGEAGTLELSRSLTVTGPTQETSPTGMVTTWHLPPRLEVILDESEPLVVVHRTDDDGGNAFFQFVMQGFRSGFCTRVNAHFPYTTTWPDGRETSGSAQRSFNPRICVDDIVGLF